MGSLLSKARAGKFEYLISFRHVHYRRTIIRGISGNSHRLILMFEVLKRVHCVLYPSLDMETDDSCHMVSSKIGEVNPDFSFSYNLSETLHVILSCRNDNAL